MSTKSRPPQPPQWEGRKDYGAWLFGLGTLANTAGVHVAARKRGSTKSSKPRRSVRERRSLPST